MSHKAAVPLHSAYSVLNRLYLQLANLTLPSNFFTYQCEDSVYNRGTSYALFRNVLTFKHVYPTRKDKNVLALPMSSLFCFVTDVSGGERLIYS